MIDDIWCMTWYLMMMDDEFMEIGDVDDDEDDVGCWMMNDDDDQWWMLDLWRW